RAPGPPRADQTGLLLHTRIELLLPVPGVQPETPHSDQEARTAVEEIASGGSATGARAANGVGEAEMNTVDKEDFVTVDPEIMHGTPVFKGTRVPIDTLFDYIATRDSLEEFLADFPSVKREYAEMAIEYARRMAA